MDEQQLQQILEQLPPEVIMILLQLPSEILALFAQLSDEEKAGIMQEMQDAEQQGQPQQGKPMTDEQGNANLFGQGY